MVSLPLSCSIISTTTSTSSQLPSRHAFSANSPHISTCKSRTSRFEVSCDASKDSENKPQGKFDRRNMLLGMSGLYGVANLVSNDAPAFGTPIAAPDLAKCTLGTNLNIQQPLTENCCPPFSEYTDYILPPVTATKRFRPAAHLVTKEYIAKYEKAVALMKALPDDDPRSFIQQAHVHCAYCNLTYEQNGDPNIKLQIHNSWHFYPWHRWYLYFYERILGKLIDDPTFGLPYWNWDHPSGMVMPDMYAVKGSPLYDEVRNPDHFPPVKADLNYAAQPTTDASKIVTNNLTEMYSEMVRNVSSLEDFYGAKYIQGTAPDPGPGSIERGSHTAMHVWVGTETTTRYDMGNFYKAGLDPLFFVHHTNIDRLWSIWRGLRGDKPKDFPDSDWLDSTYLFYDENAKLVRVNVRDTLEHDKMGYTFQKMDLPWLNYRPSARVKKSKVAKTTKAPKAKSSIFPVRLDKVVKVLVDRPRKSRSKKNKEEEEELLVIEGIEVDAANFVKFDVFVNDEDDKPDEFDKAEYAGCFAQVPHKNSTRVKSKIRLGLTELLEDLDVEDDDQILVTLVPKAGGEDIIIGGIKIIYAA